MTPSHPIPGDLMNLKSRSIMGSVIHLKSDGIASGRNANQVPTSYEQPTIIIAVIYRIEPRRDQDKKYGYAYVVTASQVGWLGWEHLT